MRGFAIIGGVSIMLTGACVLQAEQDGQREERSDQPTLDCALGEWRLALDWGVNPGTCRISGTSSTSFVVVKTGSQLEIQCAGCVSTTGRVRANGITCELDATLGFAYLEGWGVETDNYYLSADYDLGAISGSGQAVVVDDETGNCSQSFTVTGQIY